MEDYRRRYALEPLVKSVEDEELLKGRKRATVGVCYDGRCGGVRAKGSEQAAMKTTAGLARRVMFVPRPLGGWVWFVGSSDGRGPKP